MAGVGRPFNPFEKVDKVAIQRQLNNGTPEEVLHQQIMQQIIEQQMAGAGEPLNSFEAVDKVDIQKQLSNGTPEEVLQQLMQQIIEQEIVGAGELNPFEAVEILFSGSSTMALQMKH